MLRTLIGFALLSGAVFAYAKTREGQGATQPDPAPANPLDPVPVYPTASTILDDMQSTLNGTRGERNNNPGNIRITSANWQGKIAGADSAFETFANPEAGIRALAVTLKNYQRLYGLDNIAAIVSRWAPSSENNTAAYVQSVAKSTGLDPSAKLDLNNPGTLTSLVKAIIKHENGRVIYANSTIQKGVSKA